MRCKTAQNVRVNACYRVPKSVSELHAWFVSLNAKTNQRFELFYAYPKPRGS